jgi:hypothetical protein
MRSMPPKLPTEGSTPSGSHPASRQDYRGRRADGNTRRPPHHPQPPHGHPAARRTSLTRRRPPPPHRHRNPQPREQLRPRHRRAARHRRPTRHRLPPPIPQRPHRPTLSSHPHQHRLPQHHRQRHTPLRRPRHQPRIHRRRKPRPTNLRHRTHRNPPQTYTETTHGERKQRAGVNRQRPHARRPESHPREGPARLSGGGRGPRFGPPRGPVSGGEQHALKRLSARPNGLPNHPCTTQQSQSDARCDPLCGAEQPRQAELDALLRPKPAHRLSAAEPCRAASSRLWLRECWRRLCVAVSVLVCVGLGRGARFSLVVALRGALP